MPLHVDGVIDYLNLDREFGFISTDFKARCEIFMDIFWDPWPEDLHCSEFPDDPSSCIGYYEAHEPPEKLGKILVCNPFVTNYDDWYLSPLLLMLF